MVCLPLPAAAWDPEKRKSLGYDHVEMLWYILDYGVKEDGIPFAVARKYYMNDKIKQETVKLLMSKFDVSSELAGSLHFTEYGYEYTNDGKQFAMTYLRHCTMIGDEIHGTIFDDSSEETKKVFAAVDPNHASGKALVFAMSQE
jgi:aminopeptidase-like protein